MVFFRAQDGLTNDLQKKLILRLGELTGRPKTSGLHIHPILNDSRELGGNDKEISTISSVQHGKLYKRETADQLSTKKQYSAQWHSDIAFEPVPADYTSLRLVELPETGGGECDRALSDGGFQSIVSGLGRADSKQTRSGPRVTRSTTASASRTRSSSRG